MKIQLNRKWMVGLLLAATCLFPQTALADDQMQVNLMAGSGERVTLPTGQAAVSGQWLIDPCDSVSLLFGSPRQSLVVTLTSPSGTNYVVESPDQDGVHSFVFPDRDLPNLKGLNYIYQIQNPETGTWTWRIDDNQSRPKAYPVFLRMVSDSPVKAGLLGGGLDYVAGAEMTLATVVLESTASLTAYSVTATVRHASAATDSSLSFADDGALGDQAAGDGVATARFTPPTPGTYWVKARIQGTLQNGSPFVRDVETRFRAVTAHGNLQGGFLDRGVDDNGNGLFDRIGITIPLNVVTIGDYLLKVSLTTATGQVLHGKQVASLVAGTANVEVFFQSSDIRELGEDGPYAVSNVTLDYLDSTDAMQVDRREDLGTTGAYTLGQFERDPIELRGVLTSFGTDFDANDLFDRLSVTVGLDLTSYGYYRWSGRLVDSNGTELGFDFGAGTLSGSTSVTLNFSGLAIGENGVDGPYRLRNFIIYGAGLSRIVNQVGETESFAASQFEGYVNPDTEPPVLSLTADPGEIWPPNHQMIEVAIAYEVSDNMDPNPTVRLVSIVSSDGENEIGDGNTSPDIDITEDGRIYVRAERAGPKESRIYSITFSATDAAGNTALAETQVTVLHDQRRK